MVLGKITSYLFLKSIMLSYIYIYLSSISSDTFLNDFNLLHFNEPGEYEFS